MTDTEYAALLRSAGPEVGLPPPEVCNELVRRLHRAFGTRSCPCTSVIVALIAFIPGADSPSARVIIESTPRTGPGPRASGSQTLRAFRGAPALIFHPPNAEGSTGPMDRRPGVPVSRAQRAGTRAERLLGTLLSTLGLQPRSCFAAPLRRAVADHAASESAASPVWPALPRPA